MDGLPFCVLLLALCSAATLAKPHTKGRHGYKIPEFDDSKWDKLHWEKKRITKKDGVDPDQSLCKEKTCGRLQHCVMKDGVATCVCKEFCRKNDNPVCGSDGIHYPNHCELHRTACLLNKVIKITRNTDCFQDKVDGDTADNDVLPHESASESEEVRPIEQTPKQSSNEVLPPTVCNQEAFSAFKIRLLEFYAEKLLKKEDSHNGKELLVTKMFNTFNVESGDGMLTGPELDAVAIRDDLFYFDSPCSLREFLHLNNSTNESAIDINTFYEAYDMTPISLESTDEVLSTTLTAGDSIELTCDIQGGPASAIVWKRNDMELVSDSVENIKVFGDGALYISMVTLVHAGNYSCHLNYNSEVVQVHTLHVQVAPKVEVFPVKQSHKPGTNVKMHCQPTGLPLPTVSWRKNDRPVNPNDSAHITLLAKNTELTISNIVYEDTGAYTCIATNSAGAAKAYSSLFVQNEESDDSVVHKEFVVFHDKGIKFYNPDTCHMTHLIQYSDVILGTEEVVCGELNSNCSWGYAVNVQDKFIYVTQPEKNRILVVDLMEHDIFEVILTDSVPVKLWYVAHLDQVFVLCWRQMENSGSKTIEVIRKASQAIHHHTVHTQPVSDHFDLVQDMFIPEPQNLRHEWTHGYVIHQQQKGIFKLDLYYLKYDRTIDLNKYNCIPRSMAFASLGGYVIIDCSVPGQPQTSSQLVLDYLTDSVISINPTIEGTPYVSPDSEYLVNVNHQTGEVKVQQISENDISYLYDIRTTLAVSYVAFHPSSETGGYDLYLTSMDKANLLFISLATGDVQVITGVGTGEPPLSPWHTGRRIISSAGLFGRYLILPSSTGLYEIEDDTHRLKCEIGEVKHNNIIIWHNV